eukprot:TRINITY_DN17918_c0_g1_i1.p1 TRINITY_DN17918_c0_g1~~TRINITY_DN17918_c0_g1_i1.p1  ORF type:complete len:197 (-),score=15.28 TRINITY_DN17918_c0_g1_i1:250-780(-)
MSFAYLHPRPSPSSSDDDASPDPKRRALSTPDSPGIFTCEEDCNRALGIPQSPDGYGTRLGCNDLHILENYRQEYTMSWDPDGGLACIRCHRPGCNFTRLIPAPRIDPVATLALRQAIFVTPVYEQPTPPASPEPYIKYEDITPPSEIDYPSSDDEDLEDMVLGDWYYAEPDASRQ